MSDDNGGYSVEVISNQVRVTNGAESHTVVLKDKDAAREHAVLLEAAFAAGAVQDVIGRHLADNDPAPTPGPEPEFVVDDADVVSFDMAVEYRPSTNRVVVTVIAPSEVAVWRDIAGKTGVAVFPEGTSTRSYKGLPGDAAVLRLGGEDGRVLWQETLTEAVDET